jgi:hypothetical protein
MRLWGENCAGRDRLGLLGEPVVSVHALNSYVARTSAWNARLLQQRVPSPPAQEDDDGAAGAACCTLVADT